MDKILFWRFIMLGVIIGVVLLLLLIGLVVLQGMIEWGSFDADKFFKPKEADSIKDKKPLKTANKTVKKSARKPAKKGKGKK
jgi:hypothetical protein